jgi:hypothetical protein
MAKHDHQLRDMLRDLGRALSDAIAESPEIGRTLRRIRREGYTLHLLLDCKREPGDAEPVALAAPSGKAEPNFQINARDLSFLRSIGIDPTRQLRRRRT